MKGDQKGQLSQHIIKLIFKEGNKSWQNTLHLYRAKGQTGK